MSRVLRRADLLLAVLAFGIALALYLLTLYPGLNGIGDTPKFQFVGRVLGTPHPPGYPVYLLLSWLFAHLPFGNLAWRINLLSALTAATAVALLCLLMRRLDCSRTVSFAFALSFAFGRTFWSQATLAEVYALAAALLASVLLAVTSWAVSRAAWRLDLAVFLAALSLAHHTTAAMIAPALVVYVLATDARAGLSARFLARGALLVALGLSPYLLILVRNWQRAPYLGARATTLAGLWDVMRGASFEGRLFAFDIAAVLEERVPRISGILIGELTPVGALLALLGLFWLARKRRREILLLGLGAFGLVFFALNYDVPDIDVFLVPAFVLVWPIAGFGFDRLRRLIRAPLLSLLALALPVWQGAANYRVSDHHGRTFEIRYFGAVFEALPARSAIATESYTVDHMVLYKLLGEGAARGRDIVPVPGDAGSVEAARRKGYNVFAFRRTEESLAALGYRFAPMRLLDAPLDAYIASLPRGRFVLRAGRDATLRFAAIGTAEEPLALEQRGKTEARVEAEAGTPLGDADARAPVALRAETGPGGATVTVRGFEVARTQRGVAFAVLGPGGRVLEAHDLDPAENLRVPFTSRAFPFYRLTGPPECVKLGDGAWTDATAAASSGRVLLRIDNHEPYDARLSLWLASEGPLAPRILRRLGTGAPRLEVGDLEGRALRAALTADGLDHFWPRATRVELAVNDGGQFSSTTLDLGGVPAAVLAKADVDQKNPNRAAVCIAAPGDSR